MLFVHSRIRVRNSQSLFREINRVNIAQGIRGDDNQEHVERSGVQLK